MARNIDRILETLRSYLQMDVAFFSEFIGDERVFHNLVSRSERVALKAGGRLPLSSGYCNHVVSGRLPQLIADTSKVPLAAAMPETRTIPIGSHLSVPVHLRDGRFFGTFCCFSHQPRPKLGQRDLELVTTFAQLVAEEVSADIEADDIRNKVISRVESAIEIGDPQLVFQPIIRLQDMSIAGVEALSRFKSQPIRPPDVWFNEACAVGKGIELELIAVRKALDEASALPNGMTINVNLSPETLLSPESFEALKGFDPKCIVVEITEHAPVDDYSSIAEVLAPLRRAGMRIAIDDAGAGFASLRHILALRPDIIKFDTSLTRGIDADPHREALIASFSEYARRTGTKVVAEGVETTDELAILKDLGIEKAQGYLFSRPKPMNALVAELSSTHL